MKVTLGHVGINLANEAESFPFWKALLEYFEFAITPDGNHFDASDGHMFLCFTTTKSGYQASPYHRKHTGLNHVAFTVASRKMVEVFVKEFIQPRNIAMLYGGPKEYDYASDYYAVYFEDPNRIKIEVAYEGNKA